MEPVHLRLNTTYMKAHVHDGVGWMTFNNPDRRNALKLEMNAAVVDILGAFEADDSVRVVVMRGAGDKAFVSGADISEFEKLRTTPEAREQYDATMAAAGRAFATFTKPLVAMIRGFCMGGGLATALQADIRIAADDTTYAIPAGRLGVGYAFGGIEKLTHIVGPTMAAEIMLTARRFDASEAVAMGLVNRVVPVAELEEATAMVAKQIAANAPLTVRAAKAAVRETFRYPAHRDHVLMSELVEACFASEDYREGQKAFMEKRTPDFHGR